MELTLKNPQNYLFRTAAKAGGSRAVGVLDRGAKAILDEGADRGVSFKVAGYAPAPRKWDYYGDWWIGPALDDKTKIPKRVVPEMTEKLAVIRDTGVEVDLVMGHEVPKLLVGEQGKFSVAKRAWMRALGHANEHPLAAVATVLGLSLITPTLVSWLIAAFIIFVVGMAMAVGIALLAVGMVLSVGAIATVDPAIYAVTKRGHVWLEIARWV